MSKAGLTKTLGHREAQSRVLNRLRLAAGGYVCRAELITALYPDPNLEPDWAWTSVSTTIYALRQRGFPIDNQYGRGYRFVPTLECIT